MRSGSSAGVFAWVAAADDVILRRLQLAAEDQGCWLVAVSAGECASSALAGRVANRSVASAVASAVAATRVEIVKCRGGRPGVVDVAGFALDAAAAAAGFAPVSGHGARSAISRLVRPGPGRGSAQRQSAGSEQAAALDRRVLAEPRVRMSLRRRFGFARRGRRGRARATARRRREPCGSRGRHRFGNEAPHGHGAGGFFAGIREVAASRAAKPRIFGRVGADADFDGQRRGA